MVEGGKGEEKVKNVFWVSCLQNSMNGGAICISISTSSMYVYVYMYLFVSLGNEVLLWKGGETAKNWNLYVFNLRRF